MKISDLPSNDSPPHRAPTSLGVITKDYVEHTRPPVGTQSEGFELAMLRLQPVNVRHATSAIQG